jgi:hypothetical protein
VYRGSVPTGWPCALTKPAKISRIFPDRRLNEKIRLDIDVNGLWNSWQPRFSRFPRWWSAVNAQHVDDAQILACGALGTASKTYEFPANGTVAVAAALIFTAARPLRERLLGELSGSPILATMRDDRVYLACCYVALFGQVVHAALTDWWQDTAIDVLVVVVFVVSRLSNVAFVGCKQAACSGQPLERYGPQALNRRSGRWRHARSSGSSMGSKRAIG